MLSQKIDENDRRYEQRYQHTIDEANAREQAARENLTATLAATKLAVDKSEAANERRFEGVNEFRNAMQDQAARYTTRVESEARFANTIGQLSKITERLDRLEGSGAGMGKLWGLLIGGAGVLLLALEVFLRLRGG